jgi:hypothetical protein
VDNAHPRQWNPTSFNGVRWDNLFDDLEGQLEYELNAEEVDLRAEEERLRLGRLSMRDRLMSLARPTGVGGVQALVVVLGSGETLTIRPSAFGKDWLAGEILAQSTISVGSGNGGGGNGVGNAGRNGDGVGNVNGGGNGNVGNGTRGAAGSAGGNVEGVRAAGARAAGPRPQCVLPLAAIAGVVLNRHQVDTSLDPETASAPRIVDRIGLPFVLRDLCRRRKALEVHTQTGMLNGTIDRVGRDHLDLAVHAPGTLRRSREVSHYRMVPLAHIQLVRLD